MRYEELIRSVIGSSSKELKDLGPEEYNGAVGISVMNSIKNGIPSDIHSISKAMSMTVEEIELPFNRLSLNGMFLPYKWTMDTFELNTANIKEDIRMKYRWCMIAAVSSGILGNVKV